MARLTREESQALTRAKLLANAVRVVAAEGYEGASIDKIAEAAGCSKGAFYSNFSSKEELFLELLETHAGQDVVEIARLLDGVSGPAAIIDRFCEWADSRASDPTWGLLALELLRRARREATFGTRHASLFRAQWAGVGQLLLPIAPGLEADKVELLGAMVIELTYGAASGFSDKDGPSVGDLVRLALEAMQAKYAS